MNEQANLDREIEFYRNRSISEIPTKELWEELVKRKDRIKVPTFGEVLEYETPEEQRNGLLYELHDIECSLASSFGWNNMDITFTKAVDNAITTLREWLAYSRSQQPYFDKEVLEFMTNTVLQGQQPQYICNRCRKPIRGGVFIGDGNGSGQKFAHPECYEKVKSNGCGTV